jgi:hypothetical protein
MKGCSNFRCTKKKYDASVIVNNSNKIIKITNSHNHEECGGHTATYFLTTLNATSWLPCLIVARPFRDDTAIFARWAFSFRAQPTDQTDSKTHYFHLAYIKLFWITDSNITFVTPDSLTFCFAYTRVFRPPSLMTPASPLTSYFLYIFVNHYRVKYIQLFIIQNVVFLLFFYISTPLPLICLRCADCTPSNLIFVHPRSRQRSIIINNNKQTSSDTRDFRYR